MTGEIENRSPVVLKLSKSVWNRSATRSVTRSSQPHNCGGDDCKVCLTASIEKLELTIMKLKRRPGRNERKSEDVVRFVKGVIQSLPIEMRRANIRTMPASEQVCISYEDMAAHVVGLRLEYVQRLMRPLLQRFIHHPRNNAVFNSPVDVVALNIPDYLTHVKEPMDLSCVKSRLQSGGYESLKQCARDISLVFRNAMDYNADDNPIHLAAKSLNEDLEADLRAMYEKFDKEVKVSPTRSC